jgi:hypothetical protein
MLIMRKFKGNDNANFHFLFWYSIVKYKQFRKEIFLRNA